MTHNQGVAGSSPAGPTMEKQNDRGDGITTLRNSKQNL